MMSKKPYIEKAQTVAESQLATRISLLETKGITDKQIERDPTVRHFKGKIRQARRQLACIADLKEKTVRPVKELEEN